MLSSKSMPAEIKFVFVRAQHYPAFMIITASSRSIVREKSERQRVEFYYGEVINRKHTQRKTFSIVASSVAERGFSYRQRK